MTGCNLTEAEILSEFGSSDLQKKCNKCPYFVYEDGIMSCSKLEGMEELEDGIE